jgi:hypothetical protein
MLSCDLNAGRRRKRSRGGWRRGGGGGGFSPSKSSDQGGGTVRKVKERARVLGTVILSCTAQGFAGDSA